MGPYREWQLLVVQEWMDAPLLEGLERRRSQHQLLLRPSKAEEEVYTARLPLQLKIHRMQRLVSDQEDLAWISSMRGHSLHRRTTCRAQWQIWLLPEPTVALGSRTLLVVMEARITVRMSNRQRSEASGGQLRTLPSVMNNRSNMDMRLARWLEWCPVISSKVRLLVGSGPIHISHRDSISAIKQVDAHRIQMPTKCSTVTRACSCSSTTNAKWTTRSAWKKWRTWRSSSISRSGPLPIICKKVNNRITRAHWAWLRIQRITHKVDWQAQAVLCRLKLPSTSSRRFVIHC